MHGPSKHIEKSSRPRQEKLIDAYSTWDKWVSTQNHAPENAGWHRLEREATDSFTASPQDKIASTKNRGCRAYSAGRDEQNEIGAGKLPAHSGPAGVTYSHADEMIFLE
jgi:hypothetical protein